MTTEITQNLGRDVVSRIKSHGEAALVAATALDVAGGEVWIVGGAPRDVFLGKNPKDFDLMVRGLTEPDLSECLMRLPGSVSVSGESFLVHRYCPPHGGMPCEIALPRLETSTGPGHRDFEVETSSEVTVEEDLGRRDFTVNAIAVRWPDGLVVDPYHGRTDAEQKLLRVLTDKSLEDDPLRIMRAIVMIARHGLRPDTRTQTWLDLHSNRLPNLPGERLRDELDKLMESSNPMLGLRWMSWTGALEYVLPELNRTVGFDQKNPHHELDLWEHSLATLARAVDGGVADKDLRLACLLHDVGKPDSAWEDPVTHSLHYYEQHTPDGSVLGADHAVVGSKLVHDRLVKLRFAASRVDRISTLVNKHMWAYFTTAAGARRFLSYARDQVDDLLELRRCDAGGHFMSHRDLTSLARCEALINEVRASGDAFDRSQLAVTGVDLIELGMSPGPEIGRVIKALVDNVIEDPSLNDRDTLLGVARRISDVE